MIAGQLITRACTISKTSVREGEARREADVALRARVDISAFASPHKLGHARFDWIFSAKKDLVSQAKCS